MIRRDVQLADGSAGWMLISQIEHARISALLAEHCVGLFSAAELADVRREVLAAILHHDDGWADWDRAPRLDAKLGRPRSFMELESTESIDIWTMSIDAVQGEGPLAAWMVAGHFARLLESSKHARRDDRAVRWLAALSSAREAHLLSWQAINPLVHTRAVADEALQWLWAFDEVSLWLCCQCPSRGEPVPMKDEPYVAGRGTPVEMVFSAVKEGGCDRASGLAVASPFRLIGDPIEIEAAGRVVPAGRYADALAMLASSEPQTLHWRLQA